MIGLNIEIPAQDVAEVDSMLKDYVRFYKGNIAKAVEKTMVRIISALRAGTKVSSKKRPLVRNPDPRAKKDARKAEWGVYKYYQSMPRKFAPIKGTGEYGRLKYIGKKWIRGTDGELYPVREVAESNPGILIQNHKRRIINRSGLAKASWGWMLGQLGASAAAGFKPINGAVYVTRTNTETDVSITAENELKYIQKAIRPGALRTVMQRARNQMKWDMADADERARIRARKRAA
jgi:hypothetical protein